MIFKILSTSMLLFVAFQAQASSTYISMDLLRAYRGTANLNTLRMLSGHSGVEIGGRGHKSDRGSNYLAHVAYFYSVSQFEISDRSTEGAFVTIGVDYGSDSVSGIASYQTAKSLIMPISIGYIYRLDAVFIRSSFTYGYQKQTSNKLQSNTQHESSWVSQIELISFGVAF